MNDVALPVTLLGGRGGSGGDTGGAGGDGGKGPGTRISAAALLSNQGLQGRAQVQRSQMITCGWMCAGSHRSCAAT